MNTTTLTLTNRELLLLSRGLRKLPLNEEVQSLLIHVDRKYEETREWAEVR